VIWSRRISPGNSPSDMTCVAAQHPHLPTALLTYEQALRARVDACRTVTGFTKLIAAFPEVGCMDSEEGLAERVSERAHTLIHTHVRARVCTHVYMCA